MTLFVHIALPLPTPRLFTYAVPSALLGGQATETLDAKRLVGCRALVPFGKRVLTGVIVETGSPADVKDAKNVMELLDSEPAFSAPMLVFARWMADYYMASLGETLKIMLPQGMSPESVVRVSAVLRPTPEQLTQMERRAPRRAALLQELLQHDGDVSVGYLEHVVGSGTIAAQLEALENEGFIERHRTLTREVHAKTTRAVRLSPLLHDEAFFRALMDDLDHSAPKQASLLGTIFLHYSQSETVPLLAKDALKSSGGKISEAVLKALVQKNYVEEFPVEIVRTSEAMSPDNASLLVSKDESAATFTLEQDHALDKIIEATRAHKFKTFLLHGVTGSGKTLIYLRAIREALDAGKTALMLVPEIALTPQLIERFRAVFGEEIGVMHSHKSIGERFDAWQMARRGKIRIIIGARSAIFAPLPNLGIIIVDEEHEPSYKQDDPAPRYNGRDCAIVRGTIEDAVVVLGSATPSLESMFNARSGKYHLLEITGRADGAKMPTIQVVDIRLRRKQGKMNGVFSEDLLKAVVERIERREGVILFQNRRGFASRFECLDCGHIPMCPNCSVALTYHKYRDQLRCHYCGHSHAAEKSCTNCGSLTIKEIGSGTQRIEEDLHEELAKALEIYRGGKSGEKREVVIQRMDLDTTTKKGSHVEMLTRFAKGEIDILLGTQMVAKGLDFARVTLVGVINADMQMYLPDFRAAERTFQLLTQVAGRAGRSSEFHGEVIIQTAHPKHQTIIAATLGSYELFYNDELQFRREALYPPFSRFVMIEFSGKDEELVNAQAQHFAYFIPHENKAFTRLGPAPPSIARLRGLYRRIVVLKNHREHDASGRAMRSAILHAHQLYNQKYPSSAVRITIDVDAAGFV
jgi:primosomal protein N' (replication factor Y)